MRLSQTTLIPIKPIIMSIFSPHPSPAFFVALWSLLLSVHYPPAFSDPLIFLDDYSLPRLLHLPRILSPGLSSKLTPLTRSNELIPYRQLNN